MNDVMNAINERELTEEDVVYDNVDKVLDPHSSTLPLCSRRL